MSGNNIKVVCRFRPQNKLEIKEGGKPIIDIDDEGTSVKLAGQDNKANYAFDKVFGMNTRQEDIFNYSIRSIVDDVVAGYNGTVFAYGQTGSGKTFTMMGSSIDDEENKGIIPRIVEQIFTNIMESPANMEFTVKVSYMEIYMEKVRDLLNPQHDNLPIHEDKVKGVYVKGVLEVYVSSTEEVYEVMRRGSNNRVVAYTNMNAESSRSHSLVMITITQKNLDTGAAKSGKLYLVDLAGSEKVGKTGASGQTLEEAKKINKSLTALGMVINALTDGKSSHIPYRDSKLTRILQESLGGNSRTTLIINCSPSSYNEAETVSTLRFGIRAKTIKNKAKVNADLSPAELKALLKKVKSDTVSYRQYITALEGEISIWRSGGTVPELQWASLDKKNNVTNAPKQSPAARAVAETAAVDSRPSTPTPVLDKDEREELVKRENELVEQINEKETELAGREKQVQEMQEELNQLKEKEKSYANDNQQMTAELSEVKVELEKVTYDSKESAITVDSLKEANQELTAELQELRNTLAQVRESVQKEQDVSQKNASGEMTEKQQQGTLENLADVNPEDYTMTPEQLSVLKQELSESKALVEKHQDTIRTLTQDKDGLTNKTTDLEKCISALEIDLEELLEKTIADEEHDANVQDTISELKTKIEAQYAAKKEMQERELEELKRDLEQRIEEEEKLNNAVKELQETHDKLQTIINARPKPEPKPISHGGSTMTYEEKEKDLERMRKSMAQQLADFEVMKKALMRDLQNRCEKVVELEMSLDETREQYNNVLRATNNKAQQKKMTFLERNLEQLTNVQKQLVEQNAQLKKEAALSDRKLIARNERIQNLETLLQEAKERLLSQNEKFDAQLHTVRERLEQARSAKSQGGMALSFGRIAKPLRGRGAVEDSMTPEVDEKATLAARDKRSSWLPSFR
ncbi:kinesin heavy chain [Phascolomyces articulosus]|uniref:Kinesin-like protein n=1 Tax=Phascolomyces articulosus TaxID=60185 RepID=A0AAD5PLE1_9FUNG|nr:kinesin heavy chain [Phascolomyces articulosus]